MFGLLIVTFVLVVVAVLYLRSIQAELQIYCEHYIMRDDENLWWLWESINGRPAVRIDGPYTTPYELIWSDEDGKRYN